MAEQQLPKSLTHDIVLSPFGATVTEMVEAAKCAEDSGYGGVWTYDHLTGTMLDRGPSQDAFVVLGAVAAVTNRVRIGPLVANMMNRHPARLAVAMSSLQSLSGGRAVLGLGAGSAPGSRFAGEQNTVGTELLDAAGRKRRLTETIQLVKAAWRGETDFHGEFFEMNEPGLGLDEQAHPPIIIGANGAPTLEIALAHADGVNIANLSKLAELLELVDGHDLDRSFETSVHKPVEVDEPNGGVLPPFPTGSLHRRVLAFNAPFDLTAIASIGEVLNL